MQWEYLVHIVPADLITAGEIRPGELEGILNRYGNERWELVSMVATADGSDLFVLTFKREATTASTPGRAH